MIKEPKTVVLWAPVQYSVQEKVLSFVLAKSLEVFEYTNTVTDPDISVFRCLVETIFINC